jgi:small-conductance mechanosensitive channel
MTNSEYDYNGNGVIDPEEREIMIEDRRRKMEDADAKRDAQRRMTWFALSGMVLYPLAIILASMLGYSEAAGLIADIATVYVVAVSGVTAAYFGFNAMEANK